MSSGSKSKRKPKNEALNATGVPRAWAEILGVLLLGISLFVGGALFSHQFGDASLMGTVGRTIAGLTYQAIGMASYLVVVGVLAMALKSILGHRMELRWGEALGFSAATIAACALLSLTFSSYRLGGVTSGGLVGEIVADLIGHELGTAGAYLALFTVLGLGLLLSTPFSARQVLVGMARALKWSLDGVRSLRQWLVIAWASGHDDGAEQDGALQNLASEPAKKKNSKTKIPDDVELGAQGNGEDEGDEWDESGEEGWEEEDWGEEWESEDAGETVEPVETETKKARGTKNKKSAKAESPAPKSKRDKNSEVAASVESKNEGANEACSDTVEAAPPEIVVPEEEDPDQLEDRRHSRANAVDGVASPAARGPAPKSPAARAEGAKQERGGVMPVQYLTAHYELPPIHLFEAVERSKVKIDRDFVLAQAEQIERALAHFKIGGKVAKIHPGPVVTRYEFKPEAGVKLSRIETLENDLAMALEAIRIRILAPIPGSSSVGFEVPNKTRETVYVQEVLGDPTFSEGGSSKLPLVLGKNITGKPVSIDLAKAPHLLVAGATGSGKSVGVNCMLCSLLYSCTPEDLRMILIDPKMLEFSIYADIPHLLLPVITDAEKANLALRWTVNEMERRYAVLSEAKVRDIAGYNKKLPELEEEWEAEKRALEAVAADARAAVHEDGDEEAVVGSALAGVGFDANGESYEVFGGKPLEPRPEKMPYVVVVIDEFADLMMVASKEVEANVARIAAKARAAGIHLVVATQRPSVDVITGTIKNNFPSRIAFQVTSDVDSRTILDQKGAKQLLGMGDMLYMDRGKEPVRVHGCFVSEHEIEKVVEFARKQAKPAYNLEITRASENDEVEEEVRAQDALYDRAVQIVAETQKVSTSMIQRRLNIGYNRAAKIVEAMEAQGIIGPARGVAPREVLISPM
jgi:S-DNA-T family DNA segregation ATPase FtsK/SpoIIIE